MSFISDALRVVGIVGGAVLVVTGFTSPLGGALIGGAVSGFGNTAADAIDQAQARNQADAAAEQQRREADARLEQQRHDAQVRAAQVAAALNRQLARSTLPVTLLQACQEDHIDTIPGILAQMDNQQIIDLGLTPIAACPSADSQQRVLEMLEAERARRNI